MSIMKIGDSYFENLTSHEVTIVFGKEVHTLPAPEEPLQLIFKSLGGWPIRVVASCGTRNIPKPKWVREGSCDCPLPQDAKPGEIYSCECGKSTFKPVFYVVPSLVLHRIGRNDFVSPDTSRATRGDDGDVQCVEGFVVYKKVKAVKGDTVDNDSGSEIPIQG